MLLLARQMRIKIAGEWTDQKDRMVSKGLVDMMDRLCKIFDTLTACEVRLEKHRADRANKATKEEMLESARRLILDQDFATRYVWLKKTFPRTRLVDVALEDMVRDDEDGTDAPAPVSAGTPAKTTP